MPYHFYDTICGLRQREEIILYDKIIRFIPEDEQLVTDFLHAEYDLECVNFPFIPPPFDAAAALWGAKTTYTFSQLILYREHADSELGQLLPLYEGAMTAGSILSVDLCLRFLPELGETMKKIDPEDALLQFLETHMRQWHYSAIGLPQDVKLLNTDAITGNDCLLQLYANRVIEKKDEEKAQLPWLLQKVKASLGIYNTVFWKELNPAIKDEQQHS